MGSTPQEEGATPHRGLGKKPNLPLLAHFTTTRTALAPLPLRSFSLYVGMQHISRSGVRHRDLLCLEPALHQRCDPCISLRKVRPV